MKKTGKTLTSAILALMTAAAITLPVFASPATPVTLQLDEVESVSAVEAVVTDAMLDYTSDAQDDVGDETETVEEQVDSAPARKKSSDAPLFVGAAVAVVALGGVMVVCKAKGNK